MLLRIILLTIAFSLHSSYYSQVDYEAHVPLKSSGEIPSSLRESCKFMLFDNTQTPYLSIGKTTDSEIQSVYKNLASTGKLLFGDITHTSCKEILDRLVKADQEITQPLEIYAFKSSTPCILNDGKSTIYVSTALIAHTTKSEQLHFLIATQLFHIKNKSQPEFMKLNRTSDYTDRLKILGTYAADLQTKADLYALRSITKLQMNTQFAIEGLDILAAGDTVIEELPVPENYFSSQLFHFPQAFFDNSAYRFEKIIPASDQIAIRERKKMLQKNELMQSSFDLSTDLKNNFTFFQQICVLQYIEDLIIENDPEKALYHIMLMESKLPSMDYLKRMKVNAWVAFIQKSLYPILGKTTQKRIIQNAQSGNFYIALRRLNIHATEALALRIATDLTKESNDKELVMLRNYLIDFIRENGSLPVTSFKTSTFEEAAQNKSEATVSFYLYGLSDLMKDPEFIQQITNSPSPVQQKITYHSLLAVNPVAYSFHKTHFKDDKTSIKTGTLKKSIEQTGNNENLQIHFLNADTSSMSKWIDLYNLRSSYNALNLQLYNQTQFKTSVFPVNFHRINELSSHQQSDLIGVFHFENQYNINPKGYHFTGLLVAPLPFMLADLFLGGNHCQYISFIIDSKTGKLIHFENSKYRDPLTKPFIQNKIQSSFNNF